MKVEYELDQWEWQGTTRSIEIEPDDYEGMTAEEIGEAVYRDIRADAEQNLHLVFEQGEVVSEILQALKSGKDEDDD